MRPGRSLNLQDLFHMYTIGYKANVANGDGNRQKTINSDFMMHCEQEHLEFRINDFCLLHQAHWLYKIMFQRHRAYQQPLETL